MNKRISFINQNLEVYKIPLFQIINCYEKNKSFINNYKEIFECKNDFNICICSTLVDIICPENSAALKNTLYKNLGITENGVDTPEELKYYIEIVLAAMYFNSSFFVYAMNWCYFLECDARNQDVVIYRFEEPVLYELGMTASSENEAIKQIGKKIKIEKIGEFWITGHEENSSMITTFQFKFMDPLSKIIVRIHYMDSINNGTIELKASDLINGKTIRRKDIENLNYEKGFSVDLSIIKDE